MNISGFTCRSLSLQDIARYIETQNAISAAVGVKDRIGREIVLLEWQEPGFNLEDSSIAYFDADGLLAGYATFWATGETPVRPGVNWGVHPAYLERKLEKALLSWADAKASEVVHRCPPEARISLQSGARQGHTFAENTLHKAGFTVSRSYYDMEIKLMERPCPPPYPAGLVTRPYCHETDLPLLVDVVRDAFADHHGFIEGSFERDLEVFRHWLDNDPYFEPELVIFPVDEATGQVVGCLLGLTQDFRDPEAGYVDIAAGRRPSCCIAGAGWHRRCCSTVSPQFWDRGKRLVHLDVDGQSLTNAVALYERAGMHVYQRHASTYMKVLRDTAYELAKVTPD